jgi:hypothetical protein
LTGSDYSLKYLKSKEKGLHSSLKTVKITRNTPQR